MTTHNSLTLEGTYATSLAKVFRAWCDPDPKRIWFVNSDGPEGWERHYMMDFRVSGTFHKVGDGLGIGKHQNATTCLDIEPNARIVYAHKMAHNSVIHSASSDGRVCRRGCGNQAATHGTRRVLRQQRRHRSAPRRVGWAVGSVGTHTCKANDIGGAA